MKYVYVGQNIHKKMIRGQIDLSSENAVYDWLIANNLIPIRVEKKADSSSTINSFPTKSITSNDMIMFNLQMYRLLKARIPLLMALQLLEKNISNTYLTDALNKLIDGLKSGESLAKAMQSQKKVFSSLQITMVYIAETTGQLDQSFRQMSVYLQKQRDKKQAFLQAVRYPSIVMITLVIAMLVIHTVIIPKFSSVFLQIKEELPWITFFIMNISDFFIHHGNWLLIVLVLVFLIWKWWKKTEKGALLWDTILFKLPLIGKMNFESNIAQFTRTFSVMLSVGVPLLQSLQAAAASTDNQFMKKKITFIRSSLEEGESLSHSIQSANIFSPLVVQMIAIGEQSGELDSMLRYASDYYDDQVDDSVRKVTEVIEPLLIIGVGMMVMMLALGVLLPLWQLTDIQSIN